MTQVWFPSVVFFFLSTLFEIKALQPTHLQLNRHIDLKELTATRGFVDEMPSLVASTARKGRIGTSLENALTLVLNADYKPISYVSEIYCY
jgi:hypothetical protein